jgi:hypothetical protein
MEGMFEPEITRLATAVREAVTKRREAGSIATRRRVRVRRRDFNLKYHDDFGFAHFGPERSEMDVWDWHDQDVFQNSVVKELEEFKSLAAVVGTTAGMLEDFVRAISFASFHGLTDEELRERATALARQLEGQPLPVKVTAFIDGLSIAGSPIGISDSVILRQPTPEDVTEYFDFDEYGGFTFPLGETWFRVVGEFVFYAVNTGPAQIEFLRTVDALRLFRVGGVATNRYRMDSRHFLSGGILCGAGRHSRFRYTVSDSDANPLARFLKKIVPLLPDPLHLEQAATEIEIAHARYTDALFQSGAPERTITSAITALEALFLKNEPELTHRLAQRVSVFLRALGTQLDAAGTYGNVSKGYRIRSTFIHGGSLKAKDRPQAESLSAVLVEYARQCVLARFQMAVAKDELLGKLDHVMIDPSAANDLHTLLTSVEYR